MDKKTLNDTIVHSKDGAVMTLVSSGEFLMGTSPDELKALIAEAYKPEWFEDETPQHVVYLDDYYIDIHPVSNFQYEKFLTATGHPRPETWRQRKYNHPMQPVVGIDWEDALAYCEWSGKSLPTEAQWEKASRGVDGRMYPWGNTFSEVKANCMSQVKKPTEQGEYPDGVSPYGVHDMAGNVWEWVSDNYDPDYYKYSEYRNPKGPHVGTNKAVRGGSWINEKSYLRCSSRDVRRQPRSTLNFFGFRTVWNIDQLAGPKKPSVAIKSDNRVGNVVIGDYLSVANIKKIAGVEAENIPLDILYEDDHLIVLNKAAGMLVHPSSVTKTGSLVSALLYHTNGNLSRVGDSDKPGIVHRLDRHTSGTMMATKSNIAFESLKMQFMRHTIDKFYHAIVCGNPPHDQTFHLPIGKDDERFDKMAVKHFKSKHATTHMKILERFRGFCLVELKIDTGRTHQIRVHLSHVGFPIVGDWTYEGKRKALGRARSNPRLEGLLQNMKRGQLLHSKRVAFTHPITRERMEFESEYDSEFAEVLGELRAGNAN